MHSQRLNDTPLKAWVIISSNGEVSSAHCTCMAGLAETCTHVGAVLFKVEATVRCRELKTCTDKPSYWILPSNINKVNSEVGHRIDYTSAAAKRRSMNSILNAETVNRQDFRTCASNITTPLPTHTDMSHFCADLHKAGGKCVILSVLPEYCEEFKDPVQPVTDVTFLQYLRNPTLDGCDLSMLKEHCRAQTKAVYVSEQQAERIEQRTRAQHKSSIWFAARAGRITASSLHAVYRGEINSPALSTIRRICYPKENTCMTADLAWGIAHEEDARQTYIKKTNALHNSHEVSKCGFVINPAFPEIGASPDGTVNCSLCGKGCIEIKCPAKYKNHTIREACLAKDFCLEFVDGKFNLKEHHQYYTQVQAQIFVTNSKYCDFVVWTLKDCVVLRINPNPQFWNACLPKAQRFFIEVSLPELTAQYFTKNDTRPPVTTKPLPLRESQVSTVTKSTKSKSKKTKKAWCLCNGPEDMDDMVACQNENCRIKWFHFSCVGLKDAPSKDDVWFCLRCSTATSV